MGFYAPSMAEARLIIAFEVPVHQREKVIAAWDSAREFLAAQPGYIDTTLHGTIMPGARFELINVARWESAEAFMATTRAMHSAGVFKPTAGTVANPALYEVIHSD